MYRVIDTNAILYRLADLELTVADMADEIGMEETRLKRKINGTSEMTLSECQAVCEYLGIGQSDFFDFFLSDLGY